MNLYLKTRKSFENIRISKYFIAILGFLALLTLVSGHPSYNGYARSDYSYSGSESGDYNSWVNGDYTTNQFQTRTAPGEGTNSLSLKSGATKLHNGHKRGEWDYCGSEQGDYNSWVNGDYTTYQFASRTAPGEGTASLYLNGCPTPDCRTDTGNYGSYSVVDNYCSGNQPRDKKQRSYTDYQGYDGNSCTSTRRTQTRREDDGGSCRTGKNCGSWNYGSWSVDYHYCSGNTLVERQSRSKSRSCTNYRGCNGGSCSSYSYTDRATDGNSESDKDCKTGTDNYGSWSDTGSERCSNNGIEKQKSRKYTDHNGCSSGSCTSSRKTQYKWVDVKTCKLGGCSESGNNAVCVKSPGLGRPDTGLDKGKEGQKQEKKIDIGESNQGSSSGPSTGNGQVTFDRNKGVSKVDIKASKEANEVSISVRNLARNRPKSVPKPKGLVLSYREIDVSGISNSEIEKADLTFELNESKLQAVGANKDDVSVKRYHNGWQTLGGEPSTKSNGKIPIHVDTPGFSTFALTIENMRPSGSGINPQPVTKIDVQHENDRDVTVRFYNNKTGDKYGEDIISGQEGDTSTAQTTWNAADQAGKAYEFKIEVDDGVSIVTDTQDFRTVRKPNQPFNPWPPDGATGISPR